MTWRGTVLRHVPGMNAQGGHLTVRWQDGDIGRISPINVEVTDHHFDSRLRYHERAL
jgi:hypothetical protein